MFTLANYVRFAFMCREKTTSLKARVAVIGAGPAGLSAAGFLACMGYEIDIYDKLPLPGGLMIFGIPSWRIPPQRVLDGARELEEKFNVKYILKTKVYTGSHIHEEGDDYVEKHVDLQDLIDKYDLVLVATGTWRSKIPKLPGTDAKGVTTALEYLYRWKLYELKLVQSKPETGRNVVVIGAGYSAVDAAEVAARNGAEVNVVYRRTIQEAPAGVYEIERLRGEGISFTELASPVEIIAENGVVKAVKFQRMKLGEPDETGRPRPVPIPGSEFTIEADTVIFATGESPTPPLSQDIADKLGLKIGKDGSILVNNIMQTSIKKLFAAGDVVTGPSRIGPAVRNGLQAARFMHNWFLAHTGRMVSPTQVTTL